MLQRTIYLLTLLLALGAGIWLYAKLSKPHPATVEESSILVEKMEKVLKLITVEGYFTEILSHSEYQGAWGFFWDKKVLLRARAKVSVGYDLKKVVLIPDPELRVIAMGAWPEPEILSIEHTLDYYDISTGLFESMTPADYNKINRKAVENIREKALQSALMAQAREQRKEALDLMRFMAEQAGWQVREEENPPKTLAQ